MNFETWRHHARAWLFMFIGREAAAYAEYITAYRLAPTADAARHLGYIAARRKLHAEAANWFREALGHAPEDADTHFNLGFVLGEGNAPAEAVAAFGEAIRLNPSLDRAWYGTGLAHARLGQHAEAAKALEEAARLQPMNGEAWYQLGMAYHHADNGERLREVVEQLRGFDPRRSNQLIKDTGRPELQALLQDLNF
ncbi:MAG TPA: tetratricopeptide repeat protein [Rhodocyclaceae bacterium]|nr:tetratricopeptide repeat protein [Rhodocyclaceae bacterium]